MKRKLIATPEKISRPAHNFRFVDGDHLNLVRKAAAIAGLSVNAWIAHTTLQAARDQVRNSELSDLRSA